jgi:hypothetical protein
MPKQPLAEVFGYPITDNSDEARRCRKNRLCPFGNKVPNCTKDKANDPLGVCSIFDGESVIITCPIRFRERWLIAEDAAEFFFPPGAKWTTLTEVRLKDAHDKSAGNVDVVLCSYDNHGKITDFGALEVQAVYISGNVRNPFEHYMDNQNDAATMDWTKEQWYPHPDYLSSSRKRLAPQLIFKGGIFKAWGKKTAVAINRGFFETLPNLQTVDASNAEMAWFIYDLHKNPTTGIFALKKWQAVYTKFDESLTKITRSDPGDVSGFIAQLQQRVDKKLESDPPTAEVIHEPY